MFLTVHMTYRIIEALTLFSCIRIRTSDVTRVTGTLITIKYYQVAGKPLSKQHQSAPLTFRILPSAYKAAAEGGRKPRRGARKHCSLQNARMTCICSGLHTASKHPLMCDGIDGRHAACDATS